MAADDLNWVHDPEVEPQSTKRVLRQLKEGQMDSLRRTLEAKVIHGVFMREVAKEGVDQKATHQWLSDGALDADTEGWVVAAQDGVVRTREYRRRILKEPSVPNECRLCGTREETLGHILASCPAHE